jgi:uncharacterized hydrophobic protein (TIGR00271 family)
MTQEQPPESNKGKAVPIENCEAYGHLVVVPILDETSVQPLINLALSLACPDHGEVVALFIDMDEPEEHAFRLHKIQRVIETQREAGQPVELVVHTSVSITRGILDATRELRADILLLDANIPAEGGAKFGTIIENIIPIAPCPVFLYRPGKSESFSRIVVPVLEGHQAQIASQLAQALAERFAVPIEALYLEKERSEGKQAYWDETSRLGAASFDPSEGASVKQTVVQVEDLVDGFVLHAQDDDLAIADINEQGDWDAWLRGDSSLDTLRTWAGAFLVNASGAVSLPRPWWRKWESWLKPTVTEFEGEELEQDAEEASHSSLDFLVLIVISAILAAFGLILNSNAVIIGAMLVAPLMTPLIALATGLVIGKYRIMQRGGLTLIQGVLASIMVALLVGWFSSTSIVTAEMASRGNVTFLDMGVALASGVIGAYAKARKDIPSALAGVAIAAALMPPLVTVGLAISFREGALARGASLLFLTNIVSIILAASLAFIWLGMRPGKEDDPLARRRVSRILAVLLLIILVALSIRSLNTASTGRIENVLQASFQQAELVNYEIRQSDPLEIVAVVRQPVGNLDDNSEIIEARESLEELLEEPVKLSVVLEPLVDADVAAANMATQDQIDQILEQTIQSGELIESIFIPGNPSIVFALVSTDADPGTEPFVSEIKSAEAEMAVAVGLPVELQILFTDPGINEAADSSNVAFEEIIHKTLKENLHNSELIEFTFEVGNPFIVEVRVTTELDPTSEVFISEIENTEEALSEALGITVLLDVTVQPDVDS